MNYLKMKNYLLWDFFKLKKNNNMTECDIAFIQP